MSEKQRSLKKVALSSLLLIGICTRLNSSADCAEGMNLALELETRIVLFAQRVQRFVCGPSGKVYDDVGRCIEECRPTLGNYTNICGPAGLAAGTEPTKNLSMPAPKYIKKKFRNCREAAQFLNVNGCGEADVRFIPQLEPPIPITKQKDDGTFLAQQKLTWTLDLKSSSITLPQWDWPNMTTVEKEALDKFVADCKTHEEGHFKVQDEIAQKHSGVQEGTGSTEREAVNNLKEEIRKSVEYEQNDIEERDAEYDRITEHGSKQSQGPDHGFPGGNDIRLDCP